MYIEDNDLSIRSADLNDVNILCKWWSDGKIMTHAGFPNGINTDKEKLKNRLSIDNPNNRLMIIEIDSRRVGEMNYHLTGSTAEIGIKICDFSHQEKGYGRIALRMLIEYLFDDQKVQKIVLNTNLENKRAQHVYELIGFSKTGERMSAWKDQLGNLQSFVDYELLENNFIRN